MGAEEAQRLETLADGMDVGHTHEHHLTVRVVLYRREQHAINEGGVSRFIVIVKRASMRQYLGIHTLHLWLCWLRQQRMTWRPGSEAFEVGWPVSPPLSC